MPSKYGFSTPEERARQQEEEYRRQKEAHERYDQGQRAEIQRKKDLAASIDSTVRDVMTDYGSSQRPDGSWQIRFMWEHINFGYKFTYYYEHYCPIWMLFLERPYEYLVRSNKPEIVAVQDDQTLATDSSNLLNPLRQVTGLRVTSERITMGHEPWLKESFWEEEKEITQNRGKTRGWFGRQRR